ncbi:hypothetical protein RvY_07992 [Ramazzottius varieornatus]|uniref:G-protein coupled receptors family 1 profile domain-containing protein n=1 Tax=Ramazzottius varieornatus TaxID=947166 RepID=A0A1D1V926_RAMVA|nr:hypothetical protein RvY_07992 [Ramazzottius varieornatus]
MSRGVTFGGLAGPNLKEWIILEDDCNRVYNHSHNDKFASEVAQLVPVVFIPVLICLCTLGNILNIIVLCRYCRTGAKQVFLLALAISDMMVMWSVLVLYLNRYPDLLGLDLAKESSLVGSFGAFTWLHYTFGHMSDV